MSQKSSNRNALVHGLYAKDVLLPWESRHDFERLHSDLKTEFRPNGRAEEEAVLDLAFLHWRKNSVWRLWQTAVLNDPFTQDIVETGRTSWSGIRKRLRSAAKSERTLFGQIDAQSARILSQMTKLQKQLEETSDSQEIRVIEDKIAALVRALHQHVLPFLQKLQAGPNAEQSFDSANAPERVQRLVQLEAALDARMAKVLARLVGLKEFKRTPAAGTQAAALTSYNSTLDNDTLSEQAKAVKIWNKNSEKRSEQPER